MPIEVRRGRHIPQELELQMVASTTWVLRPEPSQSLYKSSQ